MLNLFKSNWKNCWVSSDGKFYPAKYKILNSRCLVKAFDNYIEGFYDGATSKKDFADEWFPDFNDSEYLTWKKNTQSGPKFPEKK